jgi:NADH-quinone oxidoreductase subunit E
LLEARIWQLVKPDVMDYVARLLHIQPIEVYEVASFYSMYNMQPVGNYVLEVCRTGPCSLVGADKLISHIEKSLNIKPGQTSSDGMFTLKQLSAWVLAGMVQCFK